MFRSELSAQRQTMTHHRSDNANETKRNGTRIYGGASLKELPTKKLTTMKTTNEMMAPKINTLLSGSRPANEFLRNVSTVYCSPNI